MIIVAATIIFVIKISVNCSKLKTAQAEQRHDFIKRW